MAAGTLFKTYGNRHLCSMYNGAFLEIDEGIDVDYHLRGYNQFFNRTYLTGFIESL
ncbi:MAG: hypothetical protein LKJ88_05980 [Bacilli bacterium]|jgi:hypothetical protein|nr:hypothetical protein [Bacilli bacterium]